MNHWLGCIDTCNGASLGTFKFVQIHVKYLTSQMATTLVDIV